VLAEILDFLFPSVCPACREAAGPGLCAACLAELPRIEHPCAWCGAPRREANDSCRACEGRGIAHLHEVAVVYHYAGVVEDLVRAAKVSGSPAAARALAELAPAPPEPIAGAVVVPVPPSPGRRSGPHLGTAIARAVARRAALPLRKLLRPTRIAAEQHRLGARERERNVDDLFRCVGTAPERVVLVDDLLTSGATASAAAAALKAAGAKQVALVCVARTPRSGERPKQPD
jgi:predicted amidophosphoribosyltransferase